MQIRTRLTFRFVFIVASILLLVLLFIYFQFKRHLQNEFYDGLRSKAQLTAQMTLGQHNSVGFQLYENAIPLKNENPSSPENISIYDRNHERVYSFNTAADPIPSSTLREILIMNECRFKHNGLCAFGLAYINPKGRTYLIVAESDFDPQYLNKLAGILAGVFCISIALVWAGGWYFAGQALSPVNRIMNQVDHILPTDLSQRLEFSNQHDELSRLVETFNRMLSRIQQAFNSQELFLSNISHELKNPLTVIISQIEIILDKDRPKAEYRNTLASVLDDMKELNEVSNKLMQLAKITTDGSTIKLEKLRVDEMLWQAKATLLKSHPEYKINFEVVNLPEDEEKLYTSGNEHLLKTAFLNLLDNGCKFSPDNKVKARLSFGKTGTIVIEIQDEGPGISEKDLPLVFEPFYRSSGTSAVKGSGIGLALVHSILKFHQIDLKVESKQGEGTTVILEFPPISDN